MTKGQRHSIREIEKIFNSYREAKLIGETAFESLRGLRNTWNWHSHAVWPSAPADSWEAWLYIAALFRRKQWRLPEGLEAITDWAEVDALVGPWERNLNIARWSDWLRDRAKIVEQTPPEKYPLRLRLTSTGIQMEWRRNPAGDFTEMKQTPFRQHVGEATHHLPFDPASIALWRVFSGNCSLSPSAEYRTAEAERILNGVFRVPGFEELVVTPNGVPFKYETEALSWSVVPPPEEEGDYVFKLVLPDGREPERALCVLDGPSSIYVTPSAVYKGPPMGGLHPQVGGPLAIPSEALETPEGLVLFDRLSVPLPERVNRQIHPVRLRAVFRCSLMAIPGSGEALNVVVRAETSTGACFATFAERGWTHARDFRKPPEAEGKLMHVDRSGLVPVPALLENLNVNWQPYESCWRRSNVGKRFPDVFTAWLASIPPDSGIVMELDPVLGSLRDHPVSGHVSLEATESGIDWFDLRVALEVSDTTLSKEEIKLLLNARGGFVRLGEKGWRRLQIQLSDEQTAELADAGLSVRDFSSEPQRLHALQLAGKTAARMLPAEQFQSIERRVGEIRTRVTPEVPPQLQATLRPYQIEGFHFLAYLTENRFGGILADDMGLGKTVQTLAWLLWLRARPDSPDLPSLVVCPKSVTDNWLTEAGRFAPELSVVMLPRGGCDAAALKAARKKAALIVINYSQLRLIDALPQVPWHAVILDEAQYIKNPQSQTASSALQLNAQYRIALSGTPIENRLLDLWSIMHFTMPGILGQRSSFSRDFDQRTDPLARRRLAARVRPFVIRRTKKEVAKDLPERTEEDLLCDMEGRQAVLYQAELKRARAMLLKVKTSSELDKLRFNILTSLLRLRQICCHPVLVDAKSADADSAKLNALMDLLEPLMEEGQKVLVFSQFVEMLNLIKTEVDRREWNSFTLTGDTEDRGALVADFQKSEGAAVFLISLRAGGFGLNLTAASYVVLYDPWWNPAVENQAIDRTHRIGQTNHVIAYRLIIKESIEEKIRALQKQKNALAQDILGEENFTRALSLDDFRFLLEGQ